MARLRMLDILFPIDKLQIYNFIGRAQKIGFSYSFYKAPLDTIPRMTPNYLHCMEYFNERKKSCYSQMLVRAPWIQVSMQDVPACTDSLFSLEPEPHLALPHYESSSSTGAVQCRPGAIFLLYVSTVRTG